MIWFVRSLHYSLIVLMFMELIEFSMVFMHRNDALSKKGLDKVFWFRRLVSIGFLFICVWSFNKIYNWEGHKPIEALAASSLIGDSSQGSSDDQCTND